MGDSVLDGRAIQAQLRKQLDGSFTPLRESDYADPDSRDLATSLNALHQLQQDLRRSRDSDLMRSEERLRRIIDSTPVGICITNEDGLYEYVNSNYCQLYGYEESELIGESFLTVVPEQYKSELAHLHAEFMGRRYELRGEWTVERKDGTQLSILADAAYIIDVDERPKKVTFVIDITDRKRAEELLHETVEKLNVEIEQRKILENTKNEVERMIRHDLRNPLNGIMAAAEIMMTDNIPDDQRELCVIIRESGAKLNSMLSASMDLVRMESGSYVVKRESVDLVSVLKGVRQEIRPLAVTGGVSIRFLVDGKELDWESRLTLEGESLYIADLFANLIRNAVEGSKRGDTVSVEILTGEVYTISVHNSGVVPREIRDVFFERYATSGKKNGTGLGTYVASLIARVHNGNIGFTTSEDAGTTVEVTLPKTQPTQSTE
jgi:PAS domain S-box-containing protein